MANKTLFSSLKSDQKKYDEAAAVLREVIRLEPQHPWAYEMLGWAYFYRQRFEDAEAVMRAALRIQSDGPQTMTHRIILGRSLAAQGKFTEGRQALDEVLRQKPNNYSAHDALGWWFVQQEQFVEAENEFRATIRLDSARADGFFGLGKALIEQQKFSEAETALREAIRIAPAHEHAPKLLARAIEGQKSASPGTESSNQKPEKYALHQNRTLLTLGELADDAGVTTKTFPRDIDFLPQL